MKKYLVAVMALLLVVTGCSKEDKATEVVEVVVEEVEVDDVAEPVQEEIYDDSAYLDFLKGYTLVSVQGFYDYSLGDGSYILSDLKSVIDENELGESVVRYAIENFNGRRILIVRLENIDPTYNNWTGFIVDNGDGLVLTDCYEDGYRTESTLYKGGTLYIGGSISASGHGASYYRIVDGVRQEVIHAEEYYGTSAEMIAYELVDKPGDIGMKYKDIASKTNMFIRSYKRDGIVKISASYLSLDENVLARENEFIGELEAMGAIVISDDEMDQFYDFSEFQGDYVVWNDLEALTNVLKVDYVWDEDGVDVIITSEVPLTDVKLMDLYVNPYDADMQVTFRVEINYVIPEITPENPFVVKMKFEGGVATRGIYYYLNDENKLYSINLSGYDGSLKLDPIQAR